MNKAISPKEKLKEFLMELFFPSFCVGCEKEGVLLCNDCRATLEISEHNYCLCNKNPLRLPPNGKNGKCARCKDKKLAGLYSALPYKERYLTKKLIRQFKYEPYVRNLARDLSEMITEHFAAAGNDAEIICQNSVLISVPLEKSKLKNRGYNQSEELAKELSKILAIPLILNNLVKTRKTLPQMELSAEERRKNLTGAFAVKNAAEIRGKKILLIDDVYTTGSTMEECARVLRKAGVKQVWGIAVAREG